MDFYLLKNNKMKKLSIIIPILNEEKSILKILAKIEAVNLGQIEKEIIIIDDFSTDSTRFILKKITNRYKIVFQNKNYGKGFAIRTGLKLTTGDYTIIQDADLEYDPEDYKVMIESVLVDKANVVYGSRRLKRGNVQHSSLSFYLGGLLVTWMTNLLYFTKLTDEPTCYKMFRSDLLKKANLECIRFEFCPEITAKITRMGEKIHEVPISYFPRQISDGKKIKWIDGLEAILILIKYRFKK
jgi:dolichol-phosphate mannosyltransferase